MLGVWYFSINSVIIKEKKGEVRKGEVPAERAEAVFEHSNTRVAGACIHSNFC